MVSFALGAFAPVEGLAGGVGADVAERGLVEDELQGLAASGGPAQVVHLAGLLQHRSQAGGRGELVGGANRVRFPASARNSAVRVAPVPGRLRMRAASGWRSRSSAIWASSSPIRRRTAMTSVANSRANSAIRASPGTTVR